MQVKNVEVKQIKDSVKNELSDNFFQICNFCEKLVKVTVNNAASCSNLSGQKFHCPFCLRNKFHHRSSRNVLAFSFRAIIGYYYYRFYAQKNSKMFLGEIEKLIDIHANIGLQSPVLSYDPVTFLWFADFNLIGKEKNKAPFKELENLICKMFKTFNLDEKVGNRFSTSYADAYWEKFNKAVLLFYQKRKRPKDKKMLIPTLIDIIPSENQDFLEQTRNFIKPNLVFRQF